MMLNLSRSLNFRVIVSVLGIISDSSRFLNLTRFLNLCLFLKLGMPFVVQFYFFLPGLLNKALIENVHKFKFKITIMKGLIL